MSDLDSLIGSAGLDLLDRVSVLVAPEPLVIDLTEAPAPQDPVKIEAAGATLRRAATMTVLMGRPESCPASLPQFFDLCLTDLPDPPRPWVSATPDQVARPLLDHPLAAVALATLMRRVDPQDVHGAIDAEAATYALLLGGADHRSWLQERGPTRPRVSEETPVRVNRDDADLHIELNRPRSRNAVDSTLRDGLTEALTLPLHDPGIDHVVLSGVGRDFCAGGDLLEFGSVPDPAVAYSVRLTRHPGRSAHLVSPRLTARLHGNCLGAGIEIPAFARRVVAKPGTVLGLPELSLGLIPGAGGTVSIRRRIGRHRTVWMALTGEPVDVRTALAWGLIDEAEGTG